jgi:hypothetical protein
LATGFYSDGTYRYVVNVGEVTDKIPCVITTTTTTVQLIASGTYECSLGTNCDGVFNISSVSGGSGAPYQTSYVVTGNPPSYNNYPATNSYINLCGGTSYTLCLKGSAGDTRCADPNTQCSYTTTTTTAGPTSTSTSTTTAAGFYYYALSTCWGEPSSIEIGRSTSSSYGTAVFLISGICHQSNGITSGPSYDVDLDTQTIVPAGCSDASCNPPTTTTQAPTTTTTTLTPYSGLILCGETNVDYYYTGTISSGDHLYSGAGNCYVSTGTITDLSGKSEIFGTINGCTCP